MSLLDESEREALLGPDPSPTPAPSLNPPPPVGVLSSEERAGLLEPNPQPSHPDVQPEAFPYQRDTTGGNILSALAKVHPGVQLAKTLGSFAMGEANQPELAYSLFPQPLTDTEQQSLRSWAPTIATGVGSMFLPEAAIAKHLGLSVPAVAGTANALWGEGQRVWQNRNEGMPWSDALTTGFSPKNLGLNLALPAMLHGGLRGVMGGDEIPNTNDLGLRAPIPPQGAAETGEIPRDFLGGQVGEDAKGWMSSLYPKLRSAAADLPASKSPYYNELYGNMRTADVVTARLEADAKKTFQDIMREVPESLHPTVFPVLDGTYPDAPSPEVANAVQRLRTEINEPFAQQAEAVGLTVRRGNKAELFEPKLEPYAPHYYSTPTMRVGDMMESPAMTVDAMAHERLNPPKNGVLNTDINDVYLNHYIPDMSRKVGLTAGFGPITEVTGDKLSRIGSRSRELIIKGAQSGEDPLATKVALDALNDAYYPTRLAPGMRGLTSATSKIVLGRNILTQLRQIPANVGNYGLSDTSEHMVRFLTDPEYRSLYEGATEPGYLQNLVQAGAVDQRGALGKSIALAEYMNRGPSAGVVPNIQRLQRMTQAGAWTGAMERKAAEYGLPREMLQEGLSAGDIQNAAIRSVQDVQLFPGGTGQRIGLTQNPLARLPFSYLDFPIGQTRMAAQRYVRPTIHGLNPFNFSPTEVGLGLGRAGLHYATALPTATAIALLGLYAGSGGSAPTNQQVKDITGGSRPFTGALADVTGVPGMMLDAAVQGYSPTEMLMGDPLSRLVEGTGKFYQKPENLLDAAILGNSMFPFLPGPVSSAMTFLRPNVRSYFRNRRELDKSSMVAP